MKKREEAEKQLVQTKKEILDAFQMRNGLPFAFQHDTYVLHVNSRQSIKALIRKEYWANEEGIMFTPFLRYGVLQALRKKMSYGVLHMTKISLLSGVLHMYAKNITDKVLQIKSLFLSYGVLHMTFFSLEPGVLHSAKVE